MSERATQVTSCVSTSLGEHAILQGGFGFPEILQGNRYGQIPFYKVSDMSTGENSTKLVLARNYVSRSLSVKRGWRPVPAGATVFAKVGAALLLNRRRILAQESLIDNNMMAAIPRDSIDSRWLYWWLQTVDFGRFVQPGALPSVNQRQMAMLKLPLLPLPEQRRIAEILDTLDDQIRATEQIIAKLKVARSGLLTNLLACGLNSDGKRRCPTVDRADFVETPLGLKPRTWFTDRLDRWLSAKPKNGYSPVEEASWSGVSMLGLGCLTIDGFEPRQLKNAPSKDPKLQGALLSDGDLLMTRANTRELVGFAGIYRDIGHPCTYPDLMMKLIPTFELSRVFLSLVLNSSDIRRQVRNAASGTSGSMVKISGAIVRSLIVPVPPVEEQRRIVERIQSALECAAAEYRRLAKLRSLKHGIMADLLTGRVRVPVETES